MADEKQPNQKQSDEDGTHWYEAMLRPSSYGRATSESSCKSDSWTNIVPSIPPQTHMRRAFKEVKILMMVKIGFKYMKEEMLEKNKIIPRKWWTDAMTEVAGAGAAPEEDDKEMKNFFFRFSMKERFSVMSYGGVN